MKTDDKRELIILKSEPKPNNRNKLMMMIMKNMFQIHTEQRSIQLTVSHRNTHTKTAQTSTVIINNGSRNSKCRPESDTQ